MRKFQDLIYNKSDIIIALVIILVAGCIISWRMNIIMDFPNRLTADGEVQISQEKESTEISETTSKDDTSNGENSTDSPDKPVYDYHLLYINYGDSADTVAGHLVNLGFFNTKSECMSIIASMNAENKLQPGQHKIPKDSTPEEVIQALTTPGI